MITIKFFVISSRVKWQKRSGVPKIRPEIAKKLAKYAKIMVFNTLILVLAGNDFK